ncbi:hypothetical protein BSZ19_03440 [Bradyrhizobium japonicum]|uniref:Radical SAM core domain-containing protein n=1 Tax=Bradyrhizobium japonicum TaxID=375 RepID=A0A1Y2JWV2_BRAJP|nr:hypothetical protein [Bradyrhizobium japonicum]OSJ36603.1 hypothetical protein BSZ19_03440 [Bradyrhizobium japonicum]
MSIQKKRIAKFDLVLKNRHGVRIEEVFRLGALRDGIQLLTTDISFPILGQIIPRLEIEIFGPQFVKKITVRINSNSPFMFDGEVLFASINDEIEQVRCRQHIDPERSPTGMYNFGMMRANGARSFVFDYHVYCCYSCEFCFKENEWEALAIQGGDTNYKANFQECLNYADRNGHTFDDKYDIVWLCTGSIKDEKTELDRHSTISRRLREAGYTKNIYVSQVVPPSIRNDRDKRRNYLSVLRDAGVSRFNTGVDIVDAGMRRKYIRGLKGEYTFEEYMAIFTDAVDVFGRFGAGSCLLAGIEAAENTINGLEELAKIGVAPAPTVLTPFVVKQMGIPFSFDLEELIDTHVRFNNIVARYELPVFSGVFSLA